MTTRRGFLKLSAGGAASLAMLFPMHAFGTSLRANSEQPLFAFLHDPQIAEVNSLAKRLSTRPQLTFSAGGDLASIWLNELRPQVSKEQTYIAGVTNGYQAFSIQEVARDLGHAIIYSSYYDQSILEKEGVDFQLEAANRNCLDVLSLNCSEPVLWLLGPSGIKFHS